MESNLGSPDFDLLPPQADASGVSVDMLITQQGDGRFRAVVSVAGFKDLDSDEAFDSLADASRWTQTEAGKLAARVKVRRKILAM